METTAVWNCIAITCGLIYVIVRFVHDRVYHWRNIVDSPSWFAIAVFSGGPFFITAILEIVIIISAIIYCLIDYVVSLM